MVSRFLLPYWCRYVGIAAILVHIPIVMIFRNLIHHGDEQQNALFSHWHLLFIATTLLVTIGLFLIAFSKERIEDEQIVKLRLDSLYWAIFVNYFILIVLLVFTKEIDADYIMELNMWAPLIFFIIRFRWVIYRLNRSAREEA